MPDGPAISVRDLVVTYDGRRVLDGINLDIARGETMVLLGGSGSGKSTLLRHIIGLANPESGQILINGTDLAGCKAGDLKKIRKGKALSPVLLLRGDAATGTPLTVADGYHRICASWYRDENVLIACRIVSLPR